MGKTSVICFSTYFDELNPFLNLVSCQKILIKRYQDCRVWLFATVQSLNKLVWLTSNNNNHPHYSCQPGPWSNFLNRIEKNYKSYCVIGVLVLCDKKVLPLPYPNCWSLIIVHDAAASSLFPTPILAANNHWLHPQWSGPKQILWVTGSWKQNN